MVVILVVVLLVSIFLNIYLVNFLRIPKLNTAYLYSYYESYLNKTVDIILLRVDKAIYKNRHHRKAVISLEELLSIETCNLLTQKIEKHLEFRGNFTVKWSRYMDETQFTIGW